MAKKITPPKTAVLIEDIPNDVLIALTEQARVEDRSRASLIRRILIDWHKQLTETQESTK